MGILAVLILIIAVMVIFFPIYKATTNYLKKRLQKAFDKFNVCVEGENLSEYSFYTTGHPYVWCETTLDDIYRKIKDANWGRGVDPGNFNVRVDTKRRSIYFVPMPSANFSWSKLMHYDEWLESNRIIGDNIARYKNLS